MLYSREAEIELATQQHVERRAHLHRQPRRKSAAAASAGRRPVHDFPHFIPSRPKHCNLQPPDSCRCRRHLRLCFIWRSPGVLGLVTHACLVVNSLANDSECPSCASLFTRLTTSDVDGRKSQRVDVQVRGEPKSGTGFQYSWARSAVLLSCEYLKHNFGEESCTTTWTRDEHPEREDMAPTNLTLVFEPSLASSEAACPCPGIRRWEKALCIQASDEVEDMYEFVLYHGRAVVLEGL